MIKFQTKSLVKHHLLQDFGLFKPGVAGVVSRKNHRHTLAKIPQFGGNWTSPQQNKGSNLTIHMRKVKNEAGTSIYIIYLTIWFFAKKTLFDLTLAETFGTLMPRWLLWSVNVELPFEKLIIKVPSGRFFWRCHSFWGHSLHVGCIPYHNYT